MLKLSIFNLTKNMERDVRSGSVFALHVKDPVFNPYHLHGSTFFHMRIEKYIFI